MENGQWVTVPMGGRDVPGQALGAPRDTKRTYTNQFGREVTVNAAVQRVVTLRGTNPDNGPVRTYKTIREENLDFVFERDEPVIGLDVTADGEVIPLKQNVADALADLKAHQAAKAAITVTPELDLDIDDATLAAFEAAETE